MANIYSKKGSSNYGEIIIFSFAQIWLIRAIILFLQPTDYKQPFSDFRE